jgi:hypothetical protein
MDGGHGGRLLRKELRRLAENYKKFGLKIRFEPVK